MKIISQIVGIIFGLTLLVVIGVSGAAAFNTIGALARCHKPRDSLLLYPQSLIMRLVASEYLSYSLQVSLLSAKRSIKTCFQYDF